MRRLATTLLLTTALAAQQPTHTPAPAPVTSLPVTHVSLYKNGVGYFEHTGHVSGDAQVTIDFTTDQLNDVLQSLTAIDLNGGRIARAGYNSTTPLDQQLRTLPLALNDDPTLQTFYASLRGSRIAISTGAVNFTGRLLSVESGAAPATPNPAADGEHLLLTLVADSGDVRTLVVTANTTVRLIDPQLHTDVSKYLQLLDANRSQGLRHLTLTDRGTGLRELHVSYISEVPIWKSTYRILLTTPKSSASTATATLQGWSVIDNTTGTDWLNVKLSLIAGAPQSFIQPLSQPIYAHRPEIPIAQEAQLAPQTFASAFTGGQSGSGLAGTVTDPSGATIPSASITATNATTGHTEHASSDRQGRFSMPLEAGTYRLDVSSPGFQHLVESNINVNGQQYASINAPLQVGAASDTVEVTAASATVNTESASLASFGSGRMVPNTYVSPAAKSRGVLGGVAGGVPGPPPPPMSYEDAASGSLSTSTNTAAFDDFFAYNIADPITILKNESALVPILQEKVTAEGVTLVHSTGSSISTPLRALWLTNTTGLTLDRGSFTVIEDGQFGGEGLLDPIHPKEKRLLSYAADQAIAVSTTNTGGTNHIVRISAAKGVVTIQRAEHRAITYLLHNAAAQPRTVVLEHPVYPGYTLDPAARPDESTPTLYRFRIVVPAGETTSLPIAQNHDGLTTYVLSSSTDSQIALILEETGNDPQLQNALIPLIDAQKKVTDTSDAVDTTKTKLDNLHADEDRQRANIVALSTADKSAKDRFVHDLNTTEDAIKSTQLELDQRTTASEAAETDLANLIDAFTFNQTL